MQETEIMGVLFELHEQGITGINVYYEGSGDSGAIESVVYTKDKLSDLDINHAFDEIQRLDSWSGRNTSLKEDCPDLWDKLEDFCNESILDDIEDWWNNDGGYGNLCILIPSGKYKVYNNVRYTETEDYYHEGELLEKAD
jgi:hypothetical protein